MQINQREGSYPHVRWIDLKGNGVMTECAVLKQDQIGNIYYIEIPALDEIDRGRLVKILTNRNARSFELWDLMSQITLNNGINALDYFHQIVRIITPAGVIMRPNEGTVGTGERNYDQRDNQNINRYEQRPENAQSTEQVQADPLAAPSAPAKRTTRKSAA